MPTTSPSTSPPPSSSNTTTLTHLAAASAGSPLYSLPDLNRSGKWKRTLARLIDPSSSGGSIPIAVDIEFHSRCSPPGGGGGGGEEEEEEEEEEAAPVPAADPQNGGDDDKSDLAYELHYVLDGRGRLSSRPLDGRGRGPRVAAGDSVASFAGRDDRRPRPSRT